MGIRKILTKADLVLASGLAAAGIAATAGFAVQAGRMAEGRSGREVVIRVDGTVYGTYPLMQDQTIPVRSAEGENVIAIDNGSVRMESATCRNQICVDTGSISQPGRSIVCLPNRVVVEIRGGTGGEGYDAVSR